MLKKAFNSLFMVVAIFMSDQSHQEVTVSTAKIYTIWDIFSIRYTGRKGRHSTLVITQQYSWRFT